MLKNNHHEINDLPSAWRACEKVFSGETFDDIAAQSKKHAIEMFEAGDAPHLQAMSEMKDVMKDPQQMQHWFSEKQREFAMLPDES